MRINILILLSVITLFADKVFATHMMAGEITYKWINGLTYEINIVTYTYTPSPADRPEYEVSWGDGSTSIIPRIDKINLPDDISKNTYVGQHTYNTSTIYVISLEDPNRNEGIINIPYSVNVPFYTESMINVFDPVYNCVVNSVDFFSTSPLIKQSNDSHFKFNLTAYDPDNDSISYELVSCKGEDGLDIPGYTIPTGVSIDSFIGEFRWDDSSTPQGQYCFAVKVKKWRYGHNVSYVLIDFMITVVSLPAISYSFSGTDSLLTDVNGNYFAILNPNDTLNLKITFFDTDISHQTAIHSLSEVFILDNPATYSSDSAMNISNGYFKWIPIIENGRKHPYLLTFRGYSENSFIGIMNDLSLFIYVNGDNDTICPPFPIDYSINDKDIFLNIINIYPIPAKNAITIENKNIGPQSYIISIKNILGQEMLKKNISFYTTSNSIDISKINNGIYFLTLLSNDWNYVRKFIKE